MSRNKWGIRSKHRMKKLHPDMKRVMYRAIEISPIDMTVLEVGRTQERQQTLLKKGRSRTLNSRHLLKVPKNAPELGKVSHAIDVAPFQRGKVVWDWQPYYIIAKAIKQAAAELEVPIEWGGDWKSIKDGPHWQLPWREYPA